jgi:hypothetical protein
MRQARSFSNPPSCSGLCRVGRDSAGRWVVCGPHNLYGGLFINRAEALRFAMFENEHSPSAVIMVPGTLELNVA